MPNPFNQIPVGKIVFYNKLTSLGQIINQEVVINLGLIWL